MVVIYDFDGTLTPYSAPQYEILKRVGYSQEAFFKRITMEKQKDESLNLYELFYKCYNDILEESGILKTEENLCLGAERVAFNHGVVDYFEKYQSSKTGIKHYIVTSGLKDYILKTPIGKYVDGVYGTTYEKNGNEYGDINYILSDVEKIKAIKDIQAKNQNTRRVIYFGDGLTDKRAFEYVYSIGGRNVFVLSNEDSLLKYNKINCDRIIDNMFLADYSDGSRIDGFIGGRLAYLKKIDSEIEER